MEQLKTTPEHAKKSPTKKASLGLLQNKTFFLNLSRPRNIGDELQKGIKALGGKLEEFFSQEINCVLTDEKIDRLKEGYKESPPKVVPVIGNASVGSLCFRKLPKKGVVKKNTVLEKAKEWNIKIQNIDHFLIWMRNALHSKKSISRYKSIKSKQTSDAVFPLRTYFLKLESVKRKYKPLYKNFERFPSVKYKPGYLKSPFDDSVGLGTSSFLSDELEAFIDTSPQTLSSPKKNVPEVMKPVAKKRAAEKRQYCECCKTYFSSLSSHLKGPRHEKFMNNESNFECVFQVLNEIKKLEPAWAKAKIRKRNLSQLALHRQAPSLKPLDCSAFQSLTRKLSLSSKFSNENVPPEVSCSLSGIRKELNFEEKESSLQIPNPKEAEASCIPLSVDNIPLIESNNNTLQIGSSQEEEKTLQPTAVELESTACVLNDAGNSSAGGKSLSVGNDPFLCMFNSKENLNEKSCTRNEMSPSNACSAAHELQNQFANESALPGYDLLTPLRTYPTVPVLDDYLCNGPEQTFLTSLSNQKSQMPELITDFSTFFANNVDSVPSNLAPKNYTTPPLHLYNLPDAVPIKLNLTASSLNNLPLDYMFEDSLTPNTLFSSDCSEDRPYNEDICGVVEAIINEENYAADDKIMTKEPKCPSKNSFLCSLEMRGGGSTENYFLGDFFDDEESPEKQFSKETATASPRSSSSEIMVPNRNETLEVNCSDPNGQWTVKQHGDTKLVFFRNSSASTDFFET